MYAGHIARFCNRQNKGYFKMKIRHLFYRNKRCNNKVILSIFGVPFYTKKYDGHHAYYSVCGIRILRKAKETVVNNIQLDTNTLNIAIDLRGGLGDQIINANFVYLLRQKIGYDGIRIDIYEPTNIASAIFKAGDFVDNVYHWQSADANKYDLCIEIARFPILRSCNKRRVLYMSPVLFDFVLMWIKDNAEKYKFIEEKPRLDGMLNKYYLSMGYKRWKQFDIGNTLGMTEKFPLPMFIDESEHKYLNTLKIPKKFITIHRGVDVRANAMSVKQWPVEYYNTLISLIRKKHPDIFIVQLGDSKERCPQFNGVDLSLIEETSLEQLKVLLKHSYLHIDGEGGMVHLRHALKGGKSIVLFGPTDPNVYGYSENINLVGKGCQGGCEWFNDHWQECCAMGILKPFCQYSLTPEVVYSNIDKCLSNK